MPKGIQLKGGIPTKPTAALVLDFTNPIHAVFAPRIGQALQRRANAPLKPSKPQATLETGLFGDSHKQQELFK